MGLLLALAAPRVQAHVVRGNVALSDQVYLSLVKVGPRVDRRGARRAARRVQAFLRDAGYELATVTASVSDAGELFMVIDEGRLERIVLPGQSALKAVAFQVMADLPVKVFNRPEFESELARLAEEYGLHVERYEIVETEASPPATFPSLASLTEDWVPPPAKHRLEIYLVDEELPTGVALHLGFRSPEGLVAGLGYRTRGLIGDRSRFEVLPIVGVRVQDFVSDGEGRRLLSRAELAMRWYSPPIVDRELRIIAEPRISWINRQRLDLQIVSYDQMIADPSLMLAWTPGRDFEIELGGGASVQRLLNIDSDPEPLTALYPTERWRPFVRAKADLELGHRDAFLQEIELDTRLYFTPRRNTFSVDLEYEMSTLLGWDLVRTEVAGTSVLGDVPFTHERSIGRFLRGVFGNFSYTALAAGLSLEYQISVARDLYRFAIFHDGVVFQARDRMTGARSPAVANSFGIGICGLLLDTFDAGAYYAVGLSSEESFDHGITVSVKQVF